MLLASCSVLMISCRCEIDLTSGTASSPASRSTKLLYAGPVRTGMGDRVRGSTPGAGNISQPPRSTQPGHPSVGRCNEYQPKGGDALRLASKGRYGS